MPQAANIVINNAAAVSKTFTSTTPASDGNIAAWELKEGAHRLAYPRFTALARPTGDKARKINIKFSVPSTYVDTATGLTKVGPIWYGEASSKVPDDFPEAGKADAIAYFSNAIAAALFKEMLKDATSAT